MELGVFLCSGVIVMNFGGLVILVVMLWIGGIVLVLFIMFIGIFIVIRVRMV